MGTVINITYKGNKLFHKLFKCPTFWSLKPHFHCPKCGKGYRCYWDGNDVTGHGIDYCTPCAKELESTPITNEDKTPNK